jgi:glucose/arabinose dehydrogenase
MQNKFIILSIVCYCLCCKNKALEKTESPLTAEISLPPGFHIEKYMEDIKDARSLCIGDRGTVFVGTRDEGNVYAVADANNDYKADKLFVIASKLDMPNGVAFRNGSLYVATLNKIFRYDSIEYHLEKPLPPVTVVDAFPDEKHHGWKYLAFGPDDKLYVPVGAPCNICEEDDKRFSTIMRMNPNGSGLEIFASGIRNSVGFDWHPETKNLWFTDNGTDQMGDDFPPDELNVAREKGSHFGFPYCHAGERLDDKYGKGKDCKSFTPPAGKLAPHTAALGVKFYTGNMFPQEYKHQLFIAEHGSWNRSEPVGYRIMTVKFHKDSVISYQPFAQGWLKNGKAWGRPVDVLVLKDGSLLVSDDFANTIYRISYQK